MKSFVFGLFIVVVLICYCRGGYILKTKYNEIKLNYCAEKKLMRRITYTKLIETRLKTLVSKTSARVSKNDYTNIPLLVFLLVRRLREEWSSLVVHIAHIDQSLHHLGLGDIRWPTSQELDGAALTVMRNQWTYSLDIQRMANGSISGKDAEINVTAIDCLYIAAMYWRNTFCDGGFEWFSQALHKFNNGDSSISRKTVLLHLESLNCIPERTKSLLSCYEILEKNPRSKLLVTKAQMKLHVRIGGKKQCSEEMFQHVSKSDLEVHRRLCSASERLPEGLQCRYVHYQQPYLRFQPFKLEELHTDPLILRFYDVITDNEAEEIKDYSYRTMSTAEVLELDGSKQRIYRRSQVAWIDDWQWKLNNRLDHRVADLTQLNVETAELNQISRYSISGEYLQHFDYLRFHGVSFLYDRIATLMFYLNDVPEGGNTIFLRLNLTVRPVKNSAVLWFNVLPNGEPDVRSLHSGCPVLYGTKWVLNKWFRNVGHEFIKPCGLRLTDSFNHYYM